MLSRLKKAKHSVQKSRFMQKTRELAHDIGTSKAGQVGSITHVASANHSGSNIQPRHVASVNHAAVNYLHSLCYHTHVHTPTLCFSLLSFFPSPYKAIVRGAVNNPLTAALRARMSRVSINTCFSFATTQLTNLFFFSFST
jgi:hypothetical protein